MSRSGEMNGNDQPHLRPKVRFPEFEEDGAWHTETIGEISEPIKEKVGKHKITPVSITAGVGFVPQADKFGRDISGEQYKNYTYLRRGDFAYNKGNSKSFPQGYVCQLHEFDEVAASSAFICFKLKGGCDATFLKGLFDRNTHGRQLAAHITSGARSNGLLNLNAGQFYGVQLPFPPKFEEQERIAECLASIDALIEAETEKLDALKDHKQGLMQQLFPAACETAPQVRFSEFEDSGNWRFCPLKELLNVRPDYGINASSIPYEEGQPIFLRITDISEDGQFIESGKVSVDAYLSDDSYLRVGDIVLARTGASVGKSYAYREEDGTMVHAGYLIRIRPNPASVDRLYLTHFLSSPDYWSWVAEVSGRGAQPGINSTQISELLVPLPPVIDDYSPLAEQQKIAQTLSSIADLVRAQAETIEALQNHKLGLLQQLFPILDEVDG